MKQIIDLQKLDALIRPAVEGQGYELVDLEWKREPVGWVFRLYIDRRPGQGYVSHEDCVNVSRETSALLDVHDVLPEHYHLEVSSPGVNRPLKRAVDFSRFVGKRAKVRLREEEALPGPEGTAPRRNFTGKIESVDGDLVCLHLDGADLVRLPVAAMEKAHLVYEF
jgi:ribosome maturation factor RimP